MKQTCLSRYNFINQHQFFCGEGGFIVGKKYKECRFSGGEMQDHLGQAGKYAPHTASSLLKLKSEFHKSKLGLTKKDPEKSKYN